jgi:hypothetical protein
MAMNTYGTDGAKLTVFGIPLDEFGETDPPITIEGLEDRSTLKRVLAARLCVWTIKRVQ